MWTDTILKVATQYKSYISKIIDKKGFDVIW